MRALGAFALRSNPRPPGSRAKSFHTCQGLRPRRAGRALAITRPSMSPSVFLTTSAPDTFSLYRGRDGHCWPPPAQIRACPIQALGSYLECMTRNRLLLTALRMRPCSCDTASRLCVRPVLCWSEFLSVPPLPSADSATVRTALFAGLLGTTSGSDCSVPCIIGYGLRPSRCGPVVGATGW